jgi:hypothetical protein
LFLNNFRRDISKNLLSNSNEFKEKEITDEYYADEYLSSL